MPTPVPSLTSRKLKEQVTYQVPCQHSPSGTHWITAMLDGTGTPKFMQSECEVLHGAELASVFAEGTCTAHVKRTWEWLQRKDKHLSAVKEYNVYAPVGMPAAWAERPLVRHNLRGRWRLETARDPSPLGMYMMRKLRVFTGLPDLTLYSGGMGIWWHGTLLVRASRSPSSDGILGSQWGFADDLAARAPRIDFTWDSYWFDRTRVIAPPLSIGGRPEVQHPYRAGQHCHECGLSFTSAKRFEAHQKSATHTNVWLHLASKLCGILNSPQRLSLLRGIPSNMSPTYGILQPKLLLRDTSPDNLQLQGSAAEVFHTGRNGATYHAYQYYAQLRNLSSDMLDVRRKDAGPYS